MSAVQNLWQTYKERESPDKCTVTTEKNRQEIPPDEYDRISNLLDVGIDISNRDEFEHFITADPIKIDCTPLEWWCRYEQRQAFPALSQMAIDILSISPMSDEPERVFSGARRTISWDRAKLGGENIEKTECLKHWNKNGFTRDLLTDVI